MSPIVLIVFAPVVIGAVAFVALLLGAAAVGACESIAAHPPSIPPTAESSHPRVPLGEVPPARAA